MGETETAFHYASRHLDIAKETGDRTGQATAQQNLTELGKVSCHLALLLPVLSRYDCPLILILILIISCCRVLATARGRG